METTDLLKKLKSIQPDKDYSRKSRMVVLSHKEKTLPILYLSPKEITMSVLRSGWAIALTAALMLLALGSFSVLKMFSPATTAVVDLTGLRAEAQAIDTQIELTNIVYVSPGNENKTSTAAAAPNAEPIKQIRRAEIESKTGVSASAKVPTEPTIDSVLETLSQ